MVLLYDEVSVPMRSTTGASGVHVFTGRADSRSAAIRIARDTYPSAHTAQ
ncbi:hypothetical protein GCM10023323_66540 [Streptomyces thinghirensis]|uniref:Uncharacterized protein n=1 Tax=Streptomyces thinghirensis TaxID=551547 RepID=A0ABP9TF25_9ACTN